VHCLHVSLLLSWVDDGAVEARLSCEYGRNFTYICASSVNSCVCDQMAEPMHGFSWLMNLGCTECGTVDKLNYELVCC
jgi:hypothetical protein